MVFLDRADAGHHLAAALEFLRGKDDLLVLGIPRGGVVVAFEVARTLQAPLDVWMAHKIGAPGNPEFAIGSVTAEGEPLLDEKVLRRLNVTPEFLAAEIVRERMEIFRRLQQYRRGRPPPLIANRTVLLIDDGIATGSTARAALRELRSHAPRQLLLATPVAAVTAPLIGEADEVIVLSTPLSFSAVGEFYQQFGQTTDVEVIALLEKAERDLPHA